MEIKYPLYHCSKNMMHSCLDNLIKAQCIVCDEHNAYVLHTFL